MPSSRREAVIARVRGRLVRYLMVTAVQIVGGEALLALFFGALHWSAIRSNLAVIAIGTGPALYMARRFVWQLDGPSHFRREVLPFWVFSILAALTSTGAAHLAEVVGRNLTDERQYQTALVMAGVLFSAGVIWVARFFALDALFERAALSAAEDVRRASGTDEPRAAR